jgi:hypothetical protein
MLNPTGSPAPLPPAQEPPSDPTERVRYWASELAALARGEAGPHDSRLVTTARLIELGAQPGACELQRAGFATGALQNLCDALAAGRYARVLAKLSNRVAKQPDSDAGNRPLVLALLGRALRVWQSQRGEFDADQDIRASLARLLDCAAAGRTLEVVIADVLTTREAIPGRKRRDAADEELVGYVDRVWRKNPQWKPAKVCREIGDARPEVSAAFISKVVERLRKAQSRARARQASEVGP